MRNQGLLPNNRLTHSLKDAFLSHLTSYTYYIWLSKNHPSAYNSYSEQNQKYEWYQLVGLFGVVYDTYERDYIDKRDALLNAVEAYFYQREKMSDKDRDIISDLCTWACTGTRITPVHVSERLHVSQFSYGLKEKNVWQDDYALVREEVSAA